MRTTLAALAATALVLTGCSSPANSAPAKPRTPPACTAALALAEQGLEATADAMDAIAAGDQAALQVATARLPELRTRYQPLAAACRALQ